MCLKTATTKYKSYNKTKQSKFGRKKKFITSCNILFLCLSVLLSRLLIIVYSFFASFFDFVLYLVAIFLMFCLSAFGVVQFTRAINDTFVPYAFYIRIFLNCFIFSILMYTICFLFELVTLFYIFLHFPRIAPHLECVSFCVSFVYFHRFIFVFSVFFSLRFTQNSNNR